MSQLDPTIDLPLAAPPRRTVRGRLRIPGWLALLLRNRKSCTGLSMVGFVIVIALIAPLISVAHPNDFNLLAARQAPSWNHLFGTTDQGSDIFSQVVLGARRSLLLGALAGVLATGLAAILGITAAYSGGLVDEGVNVLTNVFLTIPPIPLLVVVSGYLKSRGLVTMAHAKGLRDRRVMTRYAGRNAILPPLNGFAALFASAVGGLVFVEIIFSYPGAGYTLQQAVLGNDYALAQALLVVLSVCVILANLLMDLLNFVLDPRLRSG